LPVIEFAIFESWFGTISVVKKDGRIIRLDLSDNDMYQEHREIMNRFPKAVESDQSFKTVRTLLHRYLKGNLLISISRSTYRTFPNLHKKSSRNFDGYHTAKQGAIPK